MTDMWQGVADIDWTTWAPKDRATLLFVVQAEHILLIKKKRGLGAGKINGPGGRIEPGEAPVDAAVREVQEEVGVTPVGIAECGELSFQFLDGYSLHVYVFRAAEARGQLVETEEAVPLWTPLGSIPYEQMWADDALWLPLMLERRRFAGRFLFDGDRMVDHDLRLA